MTHTTAGPPPPAQWYPDPYGTGGERYWDGRTWTPHVRPRLAPYPPYGPGPAPWKGAQIGRPPEGPGSLANPGTRLVAWLLDWLVLLPVFGLLLTVTLLIAAPHFGPIVPVDQGEPVGHLPGFFWIYVTVLASAFVTGLVMVAYQTIATAKYGRSLGKKWMHIRPVRPDLSPLGWGRSFGRSAIFWCFGFIGWLGAIDPLWCCWDDKRQCLHDKVADSIVICDLAPTSSMPRAGW